MEAMRINFSVLFFAFVIALSLAAATKSYDSSLDSFLSDVKDRVDNMDHNSLYYSDLEQLSNNAQAIHQKIKQEKESKIQNKKVIDELTKKLNEETRKIREILEKIAKEKKINQPESIANTSPLIEVGDGRDLPTGLTKRMFDKKKRKVGDSETDEQ